MEVECVEEDSELVMIFPKPFGVFDRLVVIKDRRGEKRRGEDIVKHNMSELK